MTQRRRAQTLNVFVQALEGTRVVVELRRDTIVRGLLQEVRHELLVCTRLLCCCCCTSCKHIVESVSSLRILRCSGFCDMWQTAQLAWQVDREINLTLVDVTCRALEGSAQELEFLYVKGRNVRCGSALARFAVQA